MLRTIFFFLMISASALLGAAITPFSALAQQSCAARTEALSRLAGAFGEAPIGRGISAVGRLVEILTNENGETWTILVTVPAKDGLPCRVFIAGSGEAWQALNPAPAGQPM